MDKQESKKRKLTKKMKRKLAGVFAVTLLAFRWFTDGNYRNKRQRGETVMRSRSFPSLSSSIPILPSLLGEVPLQTGTERCWQIV